MIVHSKYNRATVKAQRYAAYWSKFGRQGSSTSHCRPSPHIPIDLCIHTTLPVPETHSVKVQNLPARLMTMAMFDLPVESTLFQDAAKSADLLDETGLEIWDTGPPYPLAAASDSIREIHHTQRLVEVMHGRYTRMEREIFKGNRIALHKAYDHLLEDWEVGDMFTEIRLEEGHREQVMAKLWLQWRARMAYNLYSRLRTQE